MQFVYEYGSTLQNDSCSGHCSTDEMAALAKRASDMGFKIMVDFHYSDSWADPGKQYKPAAWSGDSIQQLTKKVYDHTTDVLKKLFSMGIHPAWVQVGNETTDGMLWEEGRASKNMANFASLISSGYDAVKAMDSSINVIVHLANGQNNSLFRWMFDGLKTNNAKFDVIGMSLYPNPSTWQSFTDSCLLNANDMIARYGKSIMICEVGMEATSPQESKDFFSAIIKGVKAIPDNKGLGVFAWEPQCYNWCGYMLSAWNPDGRPTIALDAFMNATDIQKPHLTIFKKVSNFKINVNYQMHKLKIDYQSKENRDIVLRMYTLDGKSVLPAVKSTMHASSNSLFIDVKSFAKVFMWCR